MHRIIFKTIALTLALVHIFTICFGDLSFAQESTASSDSHQAIDFDKLGKIPDLVGHGDAVSTSPDRIKLMAAAPTSSAFFQKDTHTPSDKFNRILESVSTDYFTGKAQLNIPIFVPAGKRDLTLPLNVTYQSSSGNGIVGVGWSLDLGTIIRSTKRGVPKYDASDTFLAQGQELVSIGTSEFKNKIEGSFMKYVFNGTTWEVTDKLGTKYYFGSSDNSRVTTRNGIYCWALDKIVDLRGNFLTVEYLKEENELYPLTIFYTANETANPALIAKYNITFSYENRTDISLSYVIGDSVKMLKLLRAIEVYFDRKLMRKYRFEYIQSPVTQKSLLSKVTEYGSDGTTISPQVRFSYRTNTGSWSQDQSKWHAPDGDFIKSGFDRGRRVYDLNGDAMFDFVVSCRDTNESTDRQWLRATYLNSKDGFSQRPNWYGVPMGYFSYSSVDGTYFWDDGRRLVDLTGDGIPELLAATLWDPYSGSSGQYKNAYEFRYLDLINPGWVQNTSRNLGEGYFVYGNRIDGGKRFSDLNGDGLNDLSIAVDEIHWSYRPLDVVPRSVNTYINTGSGWRQDSRWNAPNGYYSTASGDGGRRLADINGDGLADFLVACDGYKAAYLNDGSGWTRNDAYNIPDGDFVAGGRDQGRMLVDINGDGLTDLVIAKAGYHAVYINTNPGWRRDDSFNIPDGDFVDSNGQDQGRYLADLDGDGVIDICIAKEGYKKAYLNQAGVGDLLTSVSNGLGARTDIEYVSSTRYDSYYPNKTGKLPFSMQVVSKITTFDGRGSSYSTNYSYKDGYFDASEREYRGFGYVRVTDAEGNYNESYFLQDSIYKGKLLKQDIRDASGKLLARTQNIWKVAQPYPGINFPYLAQTDNFIYSGANYKQTQVKYEYDSYGNPTKIISYGDVVVSWDDKSQVTEFLYDTVDWIVTLPKHATALDVQGKKVSEKWFYYDYHDTINDLPIRGLLTKEETWLYNPLTLKEDKVITRYAYDQYGNPVSVADALGRLVTTSFDTLCYDYPIRITNALGQTVETVYYGINEPVSDIVKGSGVTGQIKSVQDPNGQKTYSIYDALGRVIKIIGPNDTETSPGVIYEYNLNLQPNKITKRVKINYVSPPQYLSSYQFSDGLGRVIETKSPAQDSLQGQSRQIISGLVQYDSVGRVKEKYLPYFINTSEDFVDPIYNTPHTSYAYDALGRLIKVTNPDLTYSTISYSLWKKTLTDENNHAKSEYSDAYGRIVKVEELKAKQIYTTTYEYDPLNNLTKVKDNQNNITQIWYDSLGRKIKMNDPDMGVWAYDYDKVGNLIKQTDAKAQVLEFSYDAINRLKEKRANGQTLATYYYDNSGKQYSLGRLSSISDRSGSTDFYYDNLGREIKTTKTIDGTPYTVERTYDALDRLITLKYPDNSIIKYEYCPQGITKIRDLTNLSDYISDINYSQTGQIIRIQYGNATETKYAYEPNTLRLTSLITQSPFGKIQDLSYQFDKTDNVTQLTDYVNTATQFFLYDELNRLINATGAYGSFNYSYDSIGNMLFKEGVNLTYGKNGKLPHAVTKYGSTSIDYDANANMVKKGSIQLTYDVENRLAKVEDTSTTSQPQTISITLKLNPGWNFISFPVIPADSKIATVLSSIAGKFKQVSRYNPSTKKFEHFVGNAKYDQFNTFDYGRGYEIYISDSNPLILTLSGTLPLSKTVTLSSGHNLIFSPKNEEVGVEAAFLPLKIGVNYSKVFYYNAFLKVFQEYSASKKEFSTLKPGQAYYVYCLSASNWAITNPAVINSATFVYDGDGGRVRKTTDDGRGTIQSTTYIGSLFEKDSSGKITKNIFSGVSRICAVDSTGAKSFYHSDHLGSSNVITDASGRQTALTEFTPYGTVSKQTGSYNPRYKFTGKELDNTGLYFYGARYYDPEIGRFITADTIVQAPYDPQSLNRYSYCRNNPINYTDPTGLGWKKFWKKFTQVIIAAVIAAAVVFTWGALAPGITAMGALFSTSGAVIVSSAAASTAVLNTGEGRQFIGHLSKEVFDDIFGMRPSTARIFGTIGAYMLTNMAFQFGFAQLYGANKAITGVKDYDPSKDKLTTESILKEGKGINYGTRPQVDSQGSLKDVSKVLYSGDEAVGVATEALKIGGQSQHLGVVMKGLEIESNMAALVREPIKALSQGYLTFGISHQAVNVSLINAGYRSTITSLGGGWSTLPSTFIYGPYGGGAIGATTFEQIKDK